MVDNEDRAGRGNRPGLADVAREAGVSLATASRVISGSAYPVSAAKRHRVEEAVRASGYVPDPVAQAMVRGRTRTIGVIAGALSDPYFTEVTRGVEESARRAGFLTMLCSSDRDPGRELAYLELLRGHRATGAVLIGGAYDEPERRQALVDAAARADPMGCA